MDPELQALREARLAQLKGDSPGGGVGSAAAGGKQGGNESRPAIGTAIAAYLQPQALERLSRVNLVRPDRAQSVENYLTNIISQGHVTRKISEDEIVQLLHGVARQENKRNDAKIIFDRREELIPLDDVEMGGKIDHVVSDEDDFFE